MNALEAEPAMWLDKLDDLIHNARPVPLTDQVRVDRGDLRPARPDGATSPFQSIWPMRSANSRSASR